MALGHAVRLAAVLVLLCIPSAVAAADLDADGISDEQDNCLLSSNPSQLDIDEDGIGDACECGDVNGDGLVNTTDARLIQRCIAGAFECPALCDVTGDGGCDVDDAQVVQRYAVGGFGKPDLRCGDRPNAVQVRSIKETRR